MKTKLILATLLLLCGTAVVWGQTAAEAAFERGQMASEQKNYDKAIAEFTEVIRLDSDQAAYYNRGLAYKGKKDYDRAIADFTQVIRLDPNNAGAYYNRGYSYYFGGGNNEDKAIADYTQTIRLAVPADSWVAYRDRGIIYLLRKKDFDKAIADFEMALKIEPNSSYTQGLLKSAREQKEKQSSDKKHKTETREVDEDVYDLFNALFGDIVAFTDPRDGKKYKTTTIGKQTWLAENLNYNASGSRCYDNKTNDNKTNCEKYVRRYDRNTVMKACPSCEKYGRLYNWNTAMKACPSGWHLPSKEEWEALIVAVGGKETAGKFLKATSGWDDYKGNSGNGTDAYGFSALPGGLDHDDYGYYFHTVGYSGDWWSATEDNDDRTSAYSIYMRNDTKSITLSGMTGKNAHLISVRCLQD